MLKSGKKNYGAVEKCGTMSFYQRHGRKLPRTAPLDSACEIGAPPAPLPYIYRWNRQARKGQECEVLARGKMNSCCVRFADGYTMVTSRNALMKNKARLTDPA